MSLHLHKCEYAQVSDQLDILHQWISLKYIIEIRTDASYKYLKELYRSIFLLMLPSYLQNGEYDLSFLNDCL